MQQQPRQWPGFDKCVKTKLRLDVYIRPWPPGRSFLRRVYTSRGSERVKKHANKKRGIPISGGPLAFPAILSHHICISAIEEFSKNESVLITGIAEIFIHIKVLCCGVRELLYPINFRAAGVVSHTFGYVHGSCVLPNFEVSANSAKSSKLNPVRKFLRLQLSRFCL